MSGEGCTLCNVSWKPKHGDIWGPNVKNLLNMKIKVKITEVRQRKLLKRKTKLEQSYSVSSSELKTFSEASEDYAKKHLHRRPNNSIGCLEDAKIKPLGSVDPAHALQVIGNMLINHCKQEETASFIVSDNIFHHSSYYKKILAKQHEMNQGSGTIEYLHNPRLLYMTPKHGIVFFRVLPDTDADPTEIRAQRKSSN